MSFEVVHIGPHTLYRGDCLEILPTLAAGSVDAVVTDPPYGLGDKWSGGKKDWPLHHGHMQWDQSTADGVVEAATSYKAAIVWGG
jgi:DNA modification methylase